MPSIRAAIRVIQPDQAEVLDVFGASIAVLSNATNLQVMLGEQVVPPGYAVPPHEHAHDDEIFVMLEGELTVVGPQGETRIGPGASVELPRGLPHSFRNDTTASARVLIIALPGQHALEMFRHFDRAGSADNPLTPPDIADIAGQYGVRFI